LSAVRGRRHNTDTIRYIPLSAHNPGISPHA
jgi:hypothetical protein